MFEQNLVTAVADYRQRARAALIVLSTVCVGFATPGAAEDTDNITLRFANGQDSISGRLSEYKEGRFYLDASIGMVAIPGDGVVCIGAVCPEGTALEIENARVVLTAKDGTASLAGDLIEVAGGDYVLATIMGEQRVAVKLVRCEGEGCALVP